MLLLRDRKTQKLQKVKGKIMIKVNNPNQLNIFDPWAFLTPKRRQMLDAGWPWRWCRRLNWTAYPVKSRLCMPPLIGVSRITPAAFFAYPLAICYHRNFDPFPAWHNNCICLYSHGISRIYCETPKPDEPELKIADWIFVDVARAAQALAPRVAPSI